MINFEDLKPFSTTNSKFRLYYRLFYIYYRVLHKRIQLLKEIEKLPFAMFLKLIPDGSAQIRC